MLQLSSPVRRSAERDFMSLFIGGRSKYERAVNERIREYQPSESLVTIYNVSGMYAGRRYTHYFESPEQPFGVWQLLGAGSRLLPGHPQTMASAFCRDWTVHQQRSQVLHAFFREIAFVRSPLVDSEPPLAPYMFARTRLSKSGGYQAPAMYLNVTGPIQRSTLGLAWLLICLRWRSQSSISQFVGLH